MATIFLAPVEDAVKRESEFIVVGAYMLLNRSLGLSTRIPTRTLSAFSVTFRSPFPMLRNHVRDDWEELL